MPDKLLSCRPYDGGTPMCKLGLVDQVLVLPFATSRLEIQVNGKSLSSLEIAYQTGIVDYIEHDETTRDYDLMVLLGEPVQPSRPSPANIKHIPGGSVGSRSQLVYESLFNLINKANVDFRSVFVTYATKCSSNNKAKPTLSDIKTCSYHLLNELKVIKPKVIMPLGANALKAFKTNKTGPLTKYRGQHIKACLAKYPECDNLSLVPTFDLSILLTNRAPSVQKAITRDFRLASDIAKGNTIPVQGHKQPYTIIDTAEQLAPIVEQITKQKFFVFDTESRGLPFTKQPLICIGIGVNKEDIYIIPVYQHDPNGMDWKLKKYHKPEVFQEIKKLLKSIFEEPGIAKAAHNIKYDINVLRKHLGFRVKGMLYCTMMMHHILNELRPHDLEFLADIELGIGNYSDKIKEIVGQGKVLKKQYDHIPDHLLWPYLANDVYSCGSLVKIYLSRLRAEPRLMDLYNEEVLAGMKALVRAEWYGHKVDVEGLDELISEYGSRQIELLDNLRLKTNNEEFNPSSPAYVARAIKEAGFEDAIKDDSKVTGITTSKERLLLIQDDVPLVKDILEFRNVIKISGTYLKNIKDGLDEHNRIRYSWLQHGTESGRYSSSGIHQIPRSDDRRTQAGKKNLRDIYIASDKKLLVYMDYDQIELRMLAINSRDKAMLQLFADGVDIHKVSASILTGIPLEQINSFNRSAGKTMNFGLGYGSQGFQLVEKVEWENLKGKRLPITWKMMDKGLRSFKERFPGIKKYLDGVPRIAEKNNYQYQTSFGRIRRIGLKLSFRNAMGRAAQREIVNFSIQSTANSVTVRTTGFVEDLLTEWIESGKMHEDDCYLVNTVHDSGVWETNEELVPEFVVKLKKIAERSIPELRGHSFPCKIGVGKSWAEAEGK